MTAVASCAKHTHRGLTYGRLLRCTDHHPTGDPDHTTCAVCGCGLIVIREGNVRRIKVAGLPPNTPKSELTLSAGGERRREPAGRLSAYRDCKGFHRTVASDNIPWTESELRLAHGDR